ncbi:hypothetical protein J4462_05125 [Candidatus Pacearchaeota archaeon]|nr:hypothetical protein [Candidatus Pacearchaeota archaeon]
MKKILGSLIIVLALLAIFMRTVAWRNGFVVLEEETIGIGIFSIASPLIIGLLIMAAVLFLVILVVEHS